jgi:hypothetical protein
MNRTIRIVLGQVFAFASYDEKKKVAGNVRSVAWVVLTGIGVAAYAAW